MVVDQGPSLAVTHVAVMLTVVPTVLSNERRTHAQPKLWKIYWTRILLKLRKFAGWEGGSREVQGALDSTRPRLKFQRLPLRINRSRQLTAVARVPRIGPAFKVDAFELRDSKSRAK